MTIERYGNVAIALHWLTAFLVLSMIAIGLWMVTVPARIPMRGLLFNLHKSLGLIVLTITLVRLAWRCLHPPPRWPVEMQQRNRLTAHATHGLLYAALITQASSGYLASEFGTYGVAFFGIDLPRWASNEPQVRGFFLTLHRAGAIAVIALTTVHSAAAIYHALRRDRLHARGMW